MYCAFTVCACGEHISHVARSACFPWYCSILSSVGIDCGLGFPMIQFSNPSEDFKRKNPHIFEQPAPAFSVPTPGETKADLLREKELQIQILNLLRLKGIEVLWHRTDRKSTATPGWPDMIFAVEWGLRSIACGWEIKLPGRKLDPEQTKVMIRMMEPPNAWAYRIICSVDEA